ncbi:YitT family protein [Desulfosarcina sp. OttesenSCG-928-G10]|nr:YitT family protein [Desulfosarcina sp. OttesenSCG-928-G10]
MAGFSSPRLTSSVVWNLFLISLGATVFAVGVKAIAIPHAFVTGGISGVTLLIYYTTGLLSPGLWYLLINIPIFLVGWIYVSRRFFFYSLYGMAFVSLAMDLVNFRLPIQEPMLAVLAGGVLMGAGVGITLHSLGSTGGTDIIGIILNQRFAVPIGTFSFSFNIIVFSFSFAVLEMDLVLYSLFTSFISAQTLDYVLTMSNQRKMVLIISDQYTKIVSEIHTRLNRGATYINGIGAYTGKERRVILTVINTIQLKRLEEIVLTTDPDAFIIMENTFNVIGQGFSKRKVY